MHAFHYAFKGSSKVQGEGWNAGIYKDYLFNITETTDAGQVERIIQMRWDRL